MRLWDRARGQKPPAPYKLLSVLLSYPDRRLIEGEDELTEAIAALPPSRQKTAIERFWSYWQGASPTERAQHYVETFDFNRGTRASGSGLYLSFYLQGDKRQRGMSLLHLKRLYAAAGFHLEGKELPDYLPVILEFAGFAPPGYGETILADLRPALEAVRESLHDLGSPYAHLLDALCYGLPRLSPLEAERTQQIMREGPPGEQVGLEPFAPPEVMPETGARR
jgi:nitrate reductase molybdenum cofactor assembly chaperone NarJ/NarW